MFDLMGGLFILIGLGIIGASIHSYFAIDKAYGQYLLRIETRNILSKKPYKSPKDRDSFAKSHRKNALGTIAFGVLFTAFSVLITLAGRSMGG